LVARVDHEHAVERPVEDVRAPERRPERGTGRGAVEAHVRVVDLLPRPRLGVCVLRPEPYTAGGRVKLEQRGDDVAAVAARAVVHDRLEHQAELVEHVELDWLTLERVCDRGAGRDPAPPEELIDPGGDGELVDRFSRVILPRTGRR